MADDVTPKDEAVAIDDVKKADTNSVDNDDAKNQAPADEGNSHHAVSEPVVVHPKSDNHSVEKHKSSRSKVSLARSVFEIILLIGIIGLGAMVLNLTKDRDNLQGQLTSLNANPQAAVQKQTDELITTVGSLIQLPQNETPTVAEVSDAAKAKTQSNFFANAENGDKALLYVNAKQAILYRPSTNKVILQAPLTFNEQQAATSTTGTTTTRR